MRIEEEIDRILEDRFFYLTTLGKLERKFDAPRKTVKTACEEDERVLVTDFPGSTVFVRMESATLDMESWYGSTMNTEYIDCDIRL